MNSEIYERDLLRSTRNREYATRLAKELAWIGYPSAAAHPPKGSDEDGRAPGLLYRGGWRIEIPELEVALWSWGYNDLGNKRGRIEVRGGYLGDDHGVYGDRPNSITVADDRPEKAVAKEISRRLLKGALDWVVKVKEWHANVDAAEARIAESLKRVRELYGEDRLTTSEDERYRSRGAEVTLWPHGFGDYMHKVELTSDGDATIHRLRVNRDELLHLLAALDRAGVGNGGYEGGGFIDLEAANSLSPEDAELVAQAAAAAARK